MKSCMNCSRVSIGKNYSALSPFRQFFALPFVYLPVILLPFLLLSGLLIHIHLRLSGAKNIKPLRDFLPDWKSHRYSYKTQLVRKKNVRAITPWLSSRLFWIFNCSLYCPFSVATLEWNAYLVKIVENWWCPFQHEKKETYTTAKIDKSYWHISGEQDYLHPEDRDNPLWNENFADGEADKKEEAKNP